MELSAKEKEVLDFIKAFMKREGITPTIREIGMGMGYKSTSTTHWYFHKLINKGYITKSEDKSRYRVKGMKYVEVGKNESE